MIFLKLENHCFLLQLNGLPVAAIIANQAANPCKTVSTTLNMPSSLATSSRAPLTSGSACIFTFLAHSLTI